MKKLVRCPYCNKDLENKEIDREIKYKGNILFIKMVGEYCESCDEGFQNDEDLIINENRIKIAKNNLLQ